MTAPCVGGASPTPFDDAVMEMLRVRVNWNVETQLIDVLCADTGTGMRAHEIRQLCCGVFQTTKGKSRVNHGTVSCGKYGLGLKAATLYSQQHNPAACLKIVTTSNSSEILYIELRLDPESEEPAVVQHVESFSVDEEHRQFSGTEMRISIPAPQTTKDVEFAVDTLAVYVQSLRYTLPEFVGVDFGLEIGETSIELSWNPGEDPIDRFSSDFQTIAPDLVYATHESKGFSTNSMALFHCEAPGRRDSRMMAPRDIEITVLRYANHVPLVNADDFFLCSLTKGVLSNRIWKKLGYHCRRASSHLVNQLVASPAQTRRTQTTEPAPPSRLIIAVDVSCDVEDSTASIKYVNLKKTSLDKIYLNDAQAVCRSILDQLHKSGHIVTPTQSRDEEVLLDYAPLVANAAFGILQRSQAIPGHYPSPLAAVTTSLQDLLTQTWKE